MSENQDNKKIMVDEKEFSAVLDRLKVLESNKEDNTSIEDESYSLYKQSKIKYIKVRKGIKGQTKDMYLIGWDKDSFPREGEDKKGKPTLFSIGLFLSKDGKTHKIEIDLNKFVAESKQETLKTDFNKESKENFKGMVTKKQYQQHGTVTGSHHHMVDAGLVPSVEKYDVITHNVKLFGKDIALEGGVNGVINF